MAIAGEIDLICLGAEEGKLKRLTQDIAIIPIPTREELCGIVLRLIRRSWQSY